MDLVMLEYSSLPFLWTGQFILPLPEVLGNPRLWKQSYERMMLFHFQLIISISGVLSLHGNSSLLSENDSRRIKWSGQCFVNVFWCCYLCVDSLITWIPYPPPPGFLKENLFRVRWVYERRRREVRGGNALEAISRHLDALFWDFFRVRRCTLNFC
jgi:hypothetical protein